MHNYIPAGLSTLPHTMAHNWRSNTKQVELSFAKSKPADRVPSLRRVLSKVSFRRARDEEKHDHRHFEPVALPAQSHYQDFGSIVLAMHRAVPDFETSSFENLKARDFS